MLSGTLKVASAVVGCMGLALLGMMVTVEGEMGAIPLAMVLLGILGYAGRLLLERSIRSK